MNEETIQLAQYLEQSMRKVIPMLDHEAEEPYLPRTIQEERYAGRPYTYINRNNRELRDLLKQIRRDSIRLEKLMMKEGNF